MTRRPLVVVAAADVPALRLDVEEAVLAEVGAELVDLRGRPLGEIRSELARADALLTEALGRERVDARVVDALERCRVISVYAVGPDGVDVDAATRRGIVVTNVPDYCTVEVAEHTVALILAAWRRLRHGERVARSGSWSLDDLRPVRRLRGRTVGLLGFGRIARGVARRLSGFDVQLVAHDPYVPPELAAAAGVELCSVEELLRRSDILSVHVPLAAETSGLLDAAALALLPPGAVVVNSSRGGVVDPGALLEALRSGRLGGAALDVMSTEPPRPDHPLLGRDDVVCTPHMAYYSEDSLLELRMAVARNAALVLRGERPAFVVNPEVLNVP